MMTVEQAIKSLSSICDDERGQFCHMDKDDLAEIVSVLRKCVVTDEMVDRAARAYHYALFTSAASHEQAMRSALKAALGGE